MKNEETFDITQVEGVTPEMIKEYKRLVRHERYLEEVDAKHRTYHYSRIEEVEYLLSRETPSDDPPYKNPKLIPILIKGLAQLKAEHELWYDAIMAYYYNNSEVSYSILAKELGVCKQTVYLRVKNGLMFLRNFITDVSNDDGNDY